jgi:hypothetical protein
MRIASLVVPCLLLLASTAHAQAPFPGAVQVNGGWVPCNHDLAINAGLGCTEAPAPAPEPTTPPGCPEPFNPYGMPDEVLARCLPKPTLTNPWTKQPFAFQIGEVYRDAYGKERVMVIGVATDIGSLRRVITVRFIRTHDGTPPGVVTAAYEDRARWMPLMPDEPK